MGMGRKRTSNDEMDSNDEFKRIQTMENIFLKKQTII